MKINSFKFKNNSKNWHLEKTYFDNLNLLVGGSGVGKTTILKSLYLLMLRGRNGHLLKKRETSPNGVEVKFSL